MSDCIHICDLSARCIIGTNPEERNTPQTVVVNLKLECDLSRASVTDRIEDTVNYRTLKRNILALIKKSDFYLIERMAGRIASVCFEESRIEAVTVRVDKPGALSGARTVGVEIRRERKARR